MRPNKLMELVDRHEDAFAIIPSIVIMALAIAGIYVFDEYGWMEAILGGALITVVYQVVRWLLLRDHRRDRLLSEQCMTHDICAHTLSVLEALGLRWRFHSTGHDNDVSCDLCKTQPIEISVAKRFKAVATSLGVVHHVPAGIFCPCCGTKHAHSKDHVVAGSLKEQIACFEKDQDTYVLQPPRDLHGLRVRIRAIQESSTARIAALGNDQAELAKLERMAQEVEMDEEPRGYRAAIPNPGQTYTG